MVGITLKTRSNGAKEEISYSYSDDGTVTTTSTVTSTGNQTTSASDINVLSDPTDSYIYDSRIKSKLDVYSAAWLNVANESAVLSTSQIDAARAKIHAEADNTRADYIIMNPNSSYGSVKLGGTKTFPFSRNLSYTSSSFMTGIDVLVVQRTLMLYDFLDLADTGEDGAYGLDTMDAVKSFQTKVMGMSSPDGIVGPNTYGALLGTATKNKRNLDNLDKLQIYKTKHDYVRDMSAMSINYFNPIGTGKICAATYAPVMDTCTEITVPGAGKTTGTVGYADIVKKSTHEVWEVKPDNPNWNEDTDRGVKQLKRYITASQQQLAYGFFPLSAGHQIVPFYIRWNKTQDLFVRPGAAGIPGFPEQRGMIYYRVVSRTKRPTYTPPPVGQPIIVPPPRIAEEEAVQRQSFPDKDVLRDAVVTAGAVFVGIHVGKAILAVVAAPETGGLSLFLLLG